MIRGTYKKKFSYPEAPFAINSIVNSCDKHRSKGYSTCGTAALSMLTGLSPKYIDRHKPKSAIHWSDKAILAFLRGRGCDVQTVSKYGVTNIDPSDNWEMFPLNSKR